MEPKDEVLDHLLRLEVDLYDAAVSPHRFGEEIRWLGRDLRVEDTRPVIDFLMTAQAELERGRERAALQQVRAATRYVRERW